MPTRLFASLPASRLCVEMCYAQTVVAALKLKTRFRRSACHGVPARVTDAPASARNSTTIQVMATGIQLFLDLLAGCGVRHIFGNPGTTEMPLNDALVEDRRFQYILGLQEVPVMAMADGYAMASGGLGLVNLHISCGLGNAMGMLYNAYREGTPLLVTVGQSDRRIRFEEPILWGDMVAVTKPWTKWSCEVERVEDVPAA